MAYLESDSIELGTIEINLSGKRNDADRFVVDSGAAAVTSDFGFLFCIRDSFFEPQFGKCLDDSVNANDEQLQNPPDPVEGAGNRDGFRQVAEEFWEVPQGSTDVASLNVCEKMYANLVGKFSVQTPEGFTYALCISDRRSHYQWIRLLRKKSECAKKLVEFFNTVLRRFGNQPRVLTTFNTDNGGEILSTSLEDYFAEKNITHSSLASNDSEEMANQLITQGAV